MDKGKTNPNKQTERPPPPPYNAIVHRYLRKISPGQYVEAEVVSLAGLLEHTYPLLFHVHRVWDVLQGGESREEDVEKDALAQPLN